MPQLHESPPPNSARPRDAAAPRAIGGPVPGSALFREQAVVAYLRGDLNGSVLRAVRPRTAALVWLLASLVVSLFGVTFFGRVDVTARGGGILRGPSAVQALVAQAPGVVRHVDVRSGERVTRGQLLLEIDSSSARAALAEAESRLALLTGPGRRASEQQRRLLDRRIALLKTEGAIVQRKLAVQAESLARREAKAASYRTLRASGFVAKIEEADVAEELAGAKRQGLGLEQEAATGRGQIAALEAERDADHWKLEAEIAEATARRDALRTTLEQTRVVAPSDGFVEGIVARAGDVVEAGAPLGKVVPGEPPSEVVAVIAEKDRAFLEVGAEARVEVEQLPVAEFGALRARVVRISSDLASPSEVRELTRDGGAAAAAVYRVELALIDDAQAKRLSSHLRSSAITNVRYTLRSRRIVTLALDPLRRWLE